MNILCILESVHYNLIPKIKQDIGVCSTAHIVWNSTVFLWLRGPSIGLKQNNWQTYTS